MSIHPKPSKSSDVKKDDMLDQHEVLETKDFKRITEDEKYTSLKQRKGRTFITKGDAALCTRYGGSNTMMRFSLSYSFLPSFCARKVKK